jgi:phosphoserine aminotransferase
VFTHFVDNETVEGIEYPDDKFPYQPGVPLFDDCSSSFLTKLIDWTKVSLAFAHSQKNCGISGVTIMILDDNLLKTNPSTNIPELCDFRVYQERGGFPSLLNSSVVYSMMKMTENML